MEDNSNRNKVIALIIIVVLLLGGAWYFFMYRPAQEAKEKARLAQIAQEEAEKKRQEQEAQNKIRYDQLIQDADTAWAQEDWQAAYSLYTEASGLFPDQPYPKDQLALVNAKLDELAAREARKAVGVVEKVASPTGRFHIVVSSSVDGDLAMDYASKLAKEGNSVKIIEPAGNNKLFHRVSVGDYATWDQALTATTEFSTMGEGVWVLKY